MTTPLAFLSLCVFSQDRDIRQVVFIIFQLCVCVWSTLIDTNSVFIYRSSIIASVQMCVCAYGSQPV